jgi:hypothetical protein
VTVTVESLQDRGPVVLDLLEKAKRGDAKAAVRAADILRARGLNYREVAAFALDHAGLSAHDWEALLYEGDTAEEDT